MKRFLYASLVALGWIIILSAFTRVVDYNTMCLSLAIVIAGVMAGGD